MRKLMDFVLLWCIFCGAAFGQATNPQNTFANAVNAASPSMWLNFNDPTSAFKDQVSGLNFAGTTTPANFTLGPTGASNANQGTGAMLFLGIDSPAGSLAQFTVNFRPAPTSGTVCTFAIANHSGTSVTVASSFTITLASTASSQTFTSGTDYPPIRLTQGQVFGMLSVAGCEPGQITSGTGSGLYRYQYGTSTIPSGAKTYNYYLNPPSMYATVTTTPGTIAPQQPGFDATNARQYSAGFPWAGYAYAPNNTLGAIDWNTPWTMLIHVDRLNWDHSGSLVLASKGDSSLANGSWWELVLQQNPTNTAASQLCFYRNGYGEQEAKQHICTNGTTYDALPNTFNYDIAIEDSGTGQYNALSMWVNGLWYGTAASDSYSTGFGNVALAVTAGGSGYAASTPFTTTGGGATCVVNGTATATSGAITSIAVGATNAGCTSNPTIVLTSPTGTGATFTATSAPMSMNSTTEPLMVPGSVYGGAYTGVGGTDTSQNPTYIDEFAIFPRSLTSSQIGNLFYTTKFYQGIVNTASRHPVVILDEDVSGDPDNLFTYQMYIALHNAGVITLAGVVAEDDDPSSVALIRQMLDAAGLSDVPVSVVPGGSHNPSSYLSANIAAYNASTPLTLSAWMSSTTMYRTVFANYPTRPIDIAEGYNIEAMSYFMQSPADSISSLTGLQLLAQDAANGGMFFGQGTPAPTLADGTSTVTDGEYVVTHNGSMPMIWMQGVPMSGGPGPLSTRTANDPLYNYFKWVGSDVRQCYDCMVPEAELSSIFSFGVHINYSGGTGYANSTPFALSGGGPNCQGNGFMLASGGVPNGINFSFGGSASGLWFGSGCTSTPTVNLIGATGTGVTLTATPAPCGQLTVASGGTTFSTATCGNQYEPGGTFNTNQTPYSGMVMSWFINSLVDGSVVGAPRVPQGG